MTLHYATKCNEQQFPLHRTSEGSERGGKDFSRFLRMAQGSAAELRTQMYIARKIGILTEVEFPTLITQLKEISKMIHGLRKSLNPENQKPATEN